MITNSGSKGAWGRLLLCAPAMLLLTACAVKLVDTGYGLSGGPITNTGTISIDTGVTDARYARLNAANTFNGDQLINGTLGATVSGGPSGTNSLRFNAFSNSDTVSLESSVGSGQALHIYCKIPNADCYGIWVEGASLGGLFEGKSTGVIANGPTAGRFHGAVEVLGTLTKSAGAFKIDHPLDPEKQVPRPFVRGESGHDEHLQRSRRPGWQGRSLGEPARLVPGVKRRFSVSTHRYWQGGAQSSRGNGGYKESISNSWGPATRASVLAGHRNSP
jgi:hypothetical protein